MSVSKPIVVLGIGNVLWADEGFGVRVVEWLNHHYEFPEPVEVVDGGTQGVYLLRYVEQAERLVVIDAIDYGLTPGTLAEYHDEEVPAYLGAKKMSMHQTGFQEVLACAKLAGRYPEELLLIGVQPVELEDFGGSLRSAVRAQVQPAARKVLAYLQSRGCAPRPRHHPLAEQQRIAPAGIELCNYEDQRPSAEQACRIGDERVLLQRLDS